MSIPPDERSSRQAEKEYLRRSGAAGWERVKPFAPSGQSNLAESLQLIQDFGACVALLDPLPHHRILDVGAGGCWASEWLQRLGLSVVATDLSHDLLAIGRDRLNAAGPARLVCGDAEALPFHTGSFDRVLCLNAMHHVPDMNRALREIARVLGPEGRAVFSEPGSGHAQQAHAIRAVQDFGVQEADIDAAAFLQQCRDAGFVHAVVEPFSHVVPGHGLTADHWRTWSDLAATSRPARAVRTLRRGILELLGARKNTDLFVDAFGSEALRVLRAATQDHPVVVASKTPIDRFLNRSAGHVAALSATVEVLDAPSEIAAGDPVIVTCNITNAGAERWVADRRTPGHIQVGVQLMDADRRLLDRDYGRESIPADVPPGADVRLTVRCRAPAAPGAYVLKVDVVSEGVSWFEPHGSTPAWHPILVRPSGSDVRMRQ